MLQGLGETTERGRTGILEGIDENLDIGTEVCHGEEGGNTENRVPFSMGGQRQGEGGRGEGLGAGHQVPRSCKDSRQTEESLGPAEAEQLKIQLFPHVWFCTVFNFMTCSQDPRTILKAAITL